MDRYVLSPLKRGVVRGIAMLFFVLGALEVAEMPLPLVAPHLTAPAWNADHGLVGEPEALLPHEARIALAVRPVAKAGFLRRLEEPAVRVRHAFVTLAIDLPVIVILLGMGMALWRSTRLAHDAVQSGLKWLAVVGWACLAFAVTFPLLDGVRTVLILRGVVPTPSVLWYDPATSGTTYVLLLIAAGILAATWTISAGLRARADMAEIV